MKRCFIGEYSASAVIVSPRDFHAAMSAMTTSRIVRTDIRSLGSVTSTVTAASERASERASRSTVIDSVAPRRSQSQAIAVVVRLRHFHSQDSPREGRERSRGLPSRRRPSAVYQECLVESGGLRSRDPSAPPRRCRRPRPLRDHSGPLPPPPTSARAQPDDEDGDDVPLTLARSIPRPSTTAGESRASSRSHSRILGSVTRDEGGREDESTGGNRCEEPPGRDCSVHAAGSYRTRSSILPAGQCPGSRRCRINENSPCASRPRFSQPAARVAPAIFLCYRWRPIARQRWHDSLALRDSAIAETDVGRDSRYCQETAKNRAGDGRGRTRTRTKEKEKEREREREREKTR